MPWETGLWTELASPNIRLGGPTAVPQSAAGVGSSGCLVVVLPHISRSWTFQEQRLARQFLAFGAAEVRWDCKTECACECRGARVLQLKALVPGDISFDHEMLTPNHKSSFGCCGW